MTNEELTEKSHALPLKLNLTFVKPAAEWTQLSTRWRPPERTFPIKLGARLVGIARGR